MQSIAWYLNRLRVMSAGEIADRGLRQLRFAAERRGLLLARPGLQPDALPLGSAHPLEAPPSVDARAYVDAANDVRDGVFELFGRRFDLGVPPRWNVDPLTGMQAPMGFGKTLDYRDSRLVGDIKYLWELNRHLELVPLAQAYRLTGDVSYLETLRRLVSSWIEECPYPKGPNWCSSLELGIRLINWHLAYRLAGGPDSVIFGGTEGRAFLHAWLQSVYRHNHFVMNHLSTYASSANNHLIGELAGVFVSCCTWPCWREAGEWRRRAYDMLCEEIVHQTHPDGVNKEQAIWYQQFVVSFLALAGVCGERAGVKFPRAYWDEIARMIGFISALTDVAGHVPMIGDADDGLAFALEPKGELDPFRAVLGVGGELFDNPAWRKQSGSHCGTAHWFCSGLETVQAGDTAAIVPRAFPHGGYYLLGRRLGRADELRILVDAGPLGFLSIAGHGHADCLSVNVSIAGKEHLIDPGTYAYHVDRAWRDYFRGTGAHNTVRVDGVNQSEIGGPFLWLDKAEATVESFEHTESGDRLIARHDGYKRLRDPVIHVREVHFDDHSQVVTVVDEIRCRARHVVERFWHFAEDCEVELVDRTATSTNDGTSLRLEAEEQNTRVTMFRGSTDPIAGWISRRFASKSPTSTLVFGNEITGSCTLRTRISLSAYGNG